MFYILELQVYVLSQQGDMEEMECCLLNRLCPGNGRKLIHQTSRPIRNWTSRYILNTMRGTDVYCRVKAINRGQISLVTECDDL